MTETRRRRVPALAPDQRRAALVAATVPLLHEHGPDVSTRQIAAAAGVAEGTIFGVFKDKQSLIVASMVEALDPQPTIDALARIDRRLGLRERLTTAAALVTDRFESNAQLMATARKMLFEGGDPAAVRRMVDSRERLLTAVTEVVEPSAAQLRKPPAATARLLLVFCGANVFGPFSDRRDMDAGEMVSLLLDGLLILPSGGSTPLVVPLIGKTDQC